MRSFLPQRSHYLFALLCLLTIVACQTDPPDALGDLTVPTATATATADVTATSLPDVNVTATSVAPELPTPTASPIVAQPVELPAVTATSLSNVSAVVTSAAPVLPTPTAAPTSFQPPAPPAQPPALPSQPTPTALPTLPLSGCNAVTEIPPSECAALLELFRATGGSFWLPDTSGTTVVWFSSDSPCDWSGVSCANGHVVALQLKQRALTGQLPESLGALTELVDIQIYKNFLSGQLPMGLMGLSKLVSADFSNNKFSGPIPAEFGRMQSLEGLNLNFNSFSGRLPVELGSIPTLGWLDISYNNLTGDIPPVYRELGFFNYVGNGFNEGAPALVDDGAEQPPISPPAPPSPFTCANYAEPTIKECYALVSLFNATQSTQNGTGGQHVWSQGPSWLTDSSPCTWEGIACTAGRVTSLMLPGVYAGALPPDIGNLDALVELDLSASAGAAQFMRTEIPASIGKLTHLRVLRLDGHYVHGIIPLEIIELQRLEVLSITSPLRESAENRGMEMFQTTIGYLPMLRVLRLSGGFYGGIPQEYGRLHNLQVLDLGGVISSPFPRWVAELRNLQVLKIRSVTLTDMIPFEAGQLRQLHTLDLRETGMVGFAPRSLPNLGALQTLRLPDAMCVPDDADFAAWLAGMETVVGMLGVCESSAEFNAPAFNENGPTPAFCQTIINLQPAECEVLLTLYQTRATGKLADWFQSNEPCTWSGIFCGQGQIASLSLWGQLDGGLSAEIGNLSGLSYLEIYASDDAALRGPLPNTLWQLPNLQTLILDGHAFNGQIPETISNLNKLTVLTLSNTTLGGSLPNSIAAMPNLREVRLTSSNFSGPIPTSYAQLSDLTSFVFINTEICVPNDPALLLWARSRPQFMGATIQSGEPLIPLCG